MRKRKGFTLLELMIVVVILGVLALLAVPALLNAVAESKNSVVSGNLSAAVSTISSRVALNTTYAAADAVADLNATATNPVDDTTDAYVAAAACGPGQVAIDGAGPYTLVACDADGNTILTKTITPSTAATTSF